MIASARMLDFQSMKTAYATIKGFEVMRMIRRRHCMLIEPGSQAKCDSSTNSSISPPNPDCGASQILSGGR